MKPHTGLGAGEGLNEVDAALFVRSVACCKHHAFAHAETHLAGCEVGNHHNKLTHEVFGLL